MEEHDVDAIRRAIARAAKDADRSTQELLTLYGLERFLERLTRSVHAKSFILKGGVLLAAYEMRRPTSDIDMQVVNAGLDEEFLRRVVKDVSAVPASDGLDFRAEDGGVTARPIRDDAEYQGVRVKFVALLGKTRLAIQLDVSTGDPITPDPQRVRIEGVLPDTGFEISAHPLVNVLAEKAVTILERGGSSTRWRDYVDLRLISMLHAPTEVETRDALTAVAAHRGVTLRPTSPLSPPLPPDAQGKWARWLADQGMAARAQAALAQQIAEVSAFVDPVMTPEPSELQRTWDPQARLWR